MPDPAKKSPSLRERTFINEYLQDFNATRAARVAGYSGSDPIVAVRGWEVLQRPHVHAALTRDVNLRTACLGSTPSTTLREAAWIAHADISRIFKEDGVTIHRIIDLPIEVRRCIASVKVLKRNLTTGDGKMDEVIEVKFWNKNQALELLAKCQGLIDGQAGLEKPQPVPAFVFTDCPGISVH
jgi:hypothetical protein